MGARTAEARTPTARGRAGVHALACPAGKPAGGKDTLKRELQRTPVAQRRIDHALDPDRPMYRWREMTPGQREQTLDYRRSHRLPWHSLAHYQADTSHFLITAACYEHQHVIGASDARMLDFERRLVESVSAQSASLFAWNLLPNHYHLLVSTGDVKRLLHELGQLHGRTAF